MDNYIGQFDDHPNIALQTIRYDVACFLQLKEKSSELLSDKPYIDYTSYDYIIERLIKFPDTKKIVRTLDSYIQRLSKITEDYIRDIINDNDDSNYLIERKEALSKFIEDTRTQLSSIDLDDDIDVPTVDNILETKDTDERICREGQLILDIFGFLKEYEYMDISEWEILKENLCQFVINLKIPEIEPKLKKPNIPVWELLYLFHCLYVAIKDQSTNKIKVSDFALFLTKIFTQFKDRGINDLSGKISNHTRNKKYSNGFPSQYK